MFNLKSIDYLPENLHKYDLYQFVTGMIDESIDLSFKPNIDKLENLFNPSSSSYDPDYLLQILGSLSLQNFLSHATDKASLSMILSDIHNIKGTPEGFETVLRLLDLNYKSIVYNTQDTGCTEITIVFDGLRRINLTDISNLDKFAREIFPLCVTLRGVTNCDYITNSIVYPQALEAKFDLGAHRLDKTMILGMSRLSDTFGVIQNSSSKTIALLLCATYKTDLDPSEVLFDICRTSDILSILNYDRLSVGRLDNNIVLDRSFLYDINLGSTLIGHLRDHDLIYPFHRRRYSYNYNDRYLRFGESDNLVDLSAYDVSYGQKYKHTLHHTKTLTQYNYQYDVNNYKDSDADNEYEVDKYHGEIEWFAEKTHVNYSEVVLGNYKFGEDLKPLSGHPAFNRCNHTLDRNYYIGHDAELDLGPCTKFIHWELFKNPITEDLNFENVFNNAQIDYLDTQVIDSALKHGFYNGIYDLSQYEVNEVIYDLNLPLEYPTGISHNRYRESHVMTFIEDRGAFNSLVYDVSYAYSPLYDDSTSSISEDLLRNKFLHQFSSYLHAISTNLDNVFYNQDSIDYHYNVISLIIDHINLYYYKVSESYCSRGYGDGYSNFSSNQFRGKITRFDSSYYSTSYNLDFYNIRVAWYSNDQLNSSPISEVELEVEVDSVLTNDRLSSLSYDTTLCEASTYGSHTSIRIVDAYFDNQYYIGNDYGDGYINLSSDGSVMWYTTVSRG